MKGIWTVSIIANILILSLFSSIQEIHAETESGVTTVTTLLPTDQIEFDFIELVDGIKKPVGDIETVAESWQFSIKVTNLDSTKRFENLRLEFGYDEPVSNVETLDHQEIIFNLEASSSNTFELRAWCIDNGQGTLTPILFASVDESIFFGDTLSINCEKPSDDSLPPIPPSDPGSQYYNEYFVLPPVCLVEDASDLGGGVYQKTCTNGTETDYPDGRIVRVWNGITETLYDTSDPCKPALTLVHPDGTVASEYPSGTCPTYPYLGKLVFADKTQIDLWYDNFGFYGAASDYGEDDPGVTGPEGEQGDLGEEGEDSSNDTDDETIEETNDLEDYGNIGSETVIDTTSSDILATKAPTYTSGEVQPGDFYHKEITKAIELLRELGFDEEADAIQKVLDDTGVIEVGGTEDRAETVGWNFVTHFSTDIYLNEYLFGSEPADPETKEGFRILLDLATTLVHEVDHWNNDIGDNAIDESRAWAVELGLIEKIADKLRTDTDNALSESTTFYDEKHQLITNLETVLGTLDNRLDDYKKVAEINKFDTVGVDTSGVGEKKQSIEAEEEELSIKRDNLIDEYTEKIPLSDGSLIKITPDGNIERTDAQGETLEYYPPGSDVITNPDTGKIEIQTPDGTKTFSLDEIFDEPFVVTEGSIETETAEIPDWIKNNAKWWADGAIDDKSFN